jgi:hypothetical protein
VKESNKKENLNSETTTRREDGTMRWEAGRILTDDVRKTKSGDNSIKSKAYLSSSRRQDTNDDRGGNWADLIGTESRQRDVASAHSVS